jgi:hypothetical protein
MYYISSSSTYTLENFGWTPSLGARQISNIISPHSIDACTCYTHNYLTIIVPLRSSAKSLSSHAIMSSFTATTGVVHLPTFQLLREDFVQAFAGAARATSASTDDIGDYFNMAMASKLSIDQTPDHVRPAKDGLREVYCVFSGGGVPTFSDWNPHQVSPANLPLGR